MFLLGSKSNILVEDSPESKEDSPRVERPKEDSPRVEGRPIRQKSPKRLRLLESKDNRFVEGWNPKRILLKSKDDNTTKELEPVAGEA